MFILEKAPMSITLLKFHHIIYYFVIKSNMTCELTGQKHTHIKIVFILNVNVYWYLVSFI